jgi:hypothetical protein
VVDVQELLALVPDERDFLAVDGVEWRCLTPAEADELRRGIVALGERVDKLAQDRRDALSVTSKDGLLSSEWIARTGKAERERDDAIKDRDALRAEVEKLRGFESLACRAHELLTCVLPNDADPRHPDSISATDYAVREWLVHYRALTPAPDAARDGGMEQR